MNLAMVGAKPTGLGAYAVRCASCLERHFAATIVASHYRAASGTTVIRSPANVAIGAGALAPFRRLLYSLTGFPRNCGVVYTPSHHGVPGITTQVLTVLDLIALEHPRQHWFQYLYFKYILPRLIRRSRAVFTLSESVKQRLVTTFSLDPARIHVVPAGIDRSVFRPADVVSTNQDPFLLVVGAAYSHKNIHELIANHDLWANRYRLVIASGRGKYVRRLYTQVRSAGLQGRVNFVRYLSQDDLVSHYQRCAALIAPSKTEGFGLTPLEAIACGRPAIVSDIPAHKEILGEAAFYVVPGDRASWQKAFAGLDDGRLIEVKQQAGMRLVAQHSWENSCSALATAIHEVFPSLQRINEDRALHTNS